MKKIALIVLPIVFPLFVLSQPCLPEGITFTTQAQIDSFQINYPNCTEIEGYVLITGNDIDNLNGLSVLTSIGGGLGIGDNNALTNLTGLEGLTSIGEYLYIYNNNALTSLTAIDNMTSIGGWLQIDNNDALTSLTGLEGVTSIGISLWIERNDALTSLTGLDNVTSVGEDLHIESNAALSSLTGLDNVTYIGRHLWIEGNHALNSLSGLDNLTSIGGGLYIGYAFSIGAGNASLTNLTGLEGLTSIGGHLWIEGNDALTSLTGLENVTSIGGWLQIYNNDALTSLTGLEGVISIWGSLRIESNDALTSLTGLDKIASNSIEELRIYGNDSLSACEVQSVCGYLASPNGEVNIWSNATGCNSPEEVMDSCEAHAIITDKDLNIEDGSVSPNPFTSTTTLSYTLDMPCNVQFTIYNVQGRIVFMRQEKQPKGEQQMQWNAEGLPAGMYYFRIQAGTYIGSGKIIKMD